MEDKLYIQQEPLISTATVWN